MLYFLFQLWADYKILEAEVRISGTAIVKLAKTSITNILKILIYKNINTVTEGKHLLNIFKHFLVSQSWFNQVSGWNPLATFEKQKSQKKLRHEVL